MLATNSKKVFNKAVRGYILSGFTKVLLKRGLILLLLALMVLSSFSFTSEASAASINTNNMIKCASENESCNFPGTQVVYYGAIGYYTSGTFTQSVGCNNNTFGDPIGGVGKACYVAKGDVTYNSNGATSGSASTDSNTYEVGAAVSVLGNLGNLVKTGFTFAGWNTKEDGTGTPYAAGATFNMGTANVTLYAEWTVFPAESVYSGTGTASDPYQIATPAQLDLVRNYLDSGLYFKLTADIDLSGYQSGEGWVPIGDGSRPFQGNMEGNGHKITNLAINRPNNHYMGLFGYISNNASVSDMKLENVDVKGYAYVGGLVGYNNGTISNGSTAGYIIGNGYIVGGLAGENAGTIGNSYASVSVSGTSGTWDVGGLVGVNYETISNSYATGNVTGAGELGGMIGYNAGTINIGYATGSVTGSDGNVGGLVGYNEGTISNTYATGSVTGAGEVGGLVGVNDGSISNSYATGRVTGSAANVGGLVGYSGNRTISNSFYDSDTTKQSDTDKGDGKSNTDMKKQSTYPDSSWDFASTWGIGSSRNNGYPYLQAIQKFVTYDGNGSIGGIAPTDSNSYSQGKTVNIYNNTVTLVKTGYTFAGWNTEADGTGTNYSAGATFTMGTTDVTLYAKWTMNSTYTLRYNSNGATSGSVPTDSGSYEQGVAVSVYGNTGNLVKAGYTFAGWNTQADGNGTNYAAGATITMGTTDVTLYAKWISANTLLSSLSTDQGTLTPAFTTSNSNYTLNVSNAVSSLNITLTKADPNETLSVTGATYITVTGNVYIYNASNLIVGPNLIKIQVTAQNQTSNTYNLTVNRLSNNAELSGLTLSGITLTPAFTSGTTSYSASVGNNISSTTVTASVYDSNATMTLNGAAIAIGQASGAITLNTGTNVITIIATSQDGTPKTYTVTVTRAYPSSSRSSSSGATTFSDKVTSSDGTLTLPVGKSGEVSLDDRVKIVIPADASSKELKLTIEKVVDAQKLLTSKDVLATPVYEILKNFTENFDKEITLIFTFDPKSLKGNQTPSVFFYDETKKTWVKVGGEVNGNTITVKVNHFTKYAVFGVDQGADATENTTQTINFSDISGHWAETNIKQAASTGIVSGYPNGSFKPNSSVTRAEFAFMLINALKPQRDGAALAFTDKEKIGAWAQKAVAQAVQAGIINGYEDGSFRPDTEITRSEMAAMIANALGQSIQATVTTSFVDDKDIPAWAKGSVAAMNKQGIIEGKGSNQFAPVDKTTRAEAVTVLLKMLAQKSK
ncbi:S-layer homology domain-containing protein [Paenibacillus radicis (ex Xue et al. 2023)]|uniref:S-layer homology domain-containing protein n=1 Tax=Paenibacillus radicis (ex Xue et al. 2023) TaxID=2972489 RepID=A0ABT1YG76_9BACL|nr:S-layer homology domain-containing protein [Paenibacillus radicis (ex Xue et al. 2023)]MCR8632200.1 S-layer homology domain-containing protein [Paenibacillus radicis (ex Xue et al. 2023)]